MSNSINSITAKFSPALQVVGFSEEEALDQLTTLGEIITLAILKRIKETHPDKEINPENFDGFIKEFFPKEILEPIVKQEFNQYLNDYLGEISRDMNDDDKGKLFSKIDEIRSAISNL